jgi:hypothetical protein
LGSEGLETDGSTCNRHLSVLWTCVKGRSIKSYQTWTRVQEKCQRTADTEPDSPTCDLWDCNSGFGTRDSERDTAIHGKRSACGGGRGRVVQRLAIGLEQDEGIVVVDCLTSYISIHGAGGGLVLESDVQSRCGGSHCNGSIQL